MAFKNLFYEMWSNIQQINARDLLDTAGVIRCCDVLSKFEQADAFW